MARIKYLAADSSPVLAERIREAGYDVRFVETAGIVSEPLSNHPDMFMCRLGFSDEAPVVSCFTEGSAVPGSSYPEDIAYNAACTGRFFIHKLSNTAPALLAAAEEAGMRLVDVRQGYSKCSTVILDETSIITYDRGIAVKCRAEGMDVLEVRPGHVLLPGYDTGFIGGASGRVGSTVYFNGDLRAHPDFKAITDFIETRGLKAVWFAGWPLTDIGSII